MILCDALRIPLAAGAQMGLFNETEICESGYCMV
jgi:hypothetical protein